MTAMVYVIAADNGEVKVGLSGTPYARLSKIKRDYGTRRGFKDARLVGFVKTDHGLTVESNAHRRLLPFATGGEWFRVDPETALWVVMEEAEVFDAEPDVIRPRGLGSCDPVQPLSSA